MASDAAQAARGGDVVALHALHAQGVSLQEADAEGYTPAHLAAKHGHDYVLRVLRELGAVESLSAASKHGNGCLQEWSGPTPAHLAAERGHNGCLRELPVASLSATACVDSDWGHTEDITPAHLAAENGHADSLRVLHELGATLASLSAEDSFGRTPAHLAAEYYHADCLRALHELGASLSTPSEGMWLLFSPQYAMEAFHCTPAHRAAEFGNEGCLRVLHELGAGASLTAPDTEGRTPAYYAAGAGRDGCLRVLGELAGGAGLSAADEAGRTPAHAAVEYPEFDNGADCLQALHELGASLWAFDANGFTPAHVATKDGNADCLQVLAHGAAENGRANYLRVLHELGAAASLSAADEAGRTPAHAAAEYDHAGCLQALHELGASLWAFDANGFTPAHFAAWRGNVSCLRALPGTRVSQGHTPAHVAADYGQADSLRALHAIGEVGSLSAANESGATPAHCAAEHGHYGCLRVLHELLSETYAPLLAMDPGLATGLPEVLRELKAKQALSWSPADIATPAEHAAEKCHVSCFEFLVSIGGAATFLADLASSPGRIESVFAILLSKPSLLDLPTKRAWLHTRLEAKVGNADDITLSLVARRDNILDGLCAQLGVDEATGSLVDGTRAQRLNVMYQGEAAAGDALRREWFGQATAEMVDGRTGLFSLDKQQTLRPNPNSATEAGPDHLSYFALLGRITGLALYHQETLNVSWSTAFLKAAFGYEIAFDDLELEDPSLYSSQKQLLSLSAEDLEAVSRRDCLTFEVDGDEPSPLLQDSSKRRRATELKLGGADEAVTTANINEYLHLYARHKLLGTIESQVSAFRSGLGVFFDEDLLATFRMCCTVAEVQLLICGQPAIDVDDWEQFTVYNPPCYRHSSAVAWLWKAVRAMSAVERAQLLFFATASTRPPATGFNSLMGYGGAEQRFTVTRFDGPSAAERLPTASACFNRLYLPEYRSEVELRAKLRLALTESQGFAEAAVAT